MSGSTQPLPKGKHTEATSKAPNQTQEEQVDSDTDLDGLDFPEVPKVSLRPSANVESAPPMVPPISVPDPQIVINSTKHGEPIGNQPEDPPLEFEQVIREKSIDEKDGEPHAVVYGPADKQFLPFISPPPLSASSFTRQSSTSPPLSRTKSEANVDLQDVLAAAQAAAETAERAAAAARSAASLAQVRITELTKKSNDLVSEGGCENPFHTDSPDRSPAENPKLYSQNLHGASDATVSFSEPHQVYEGGRRSEASNLSPLNSFKADLDDSLPEDRVLGSSEPGRNPPQRLTSMEDDSYFSYPNLFTSQNSNLGSGSHSFTDNKTAFNP